MSGNSCIQAHCCWNQFPVPLGTPSMPGIWPEATETPTPVSNLISTDADRKSPRKPSRSSRASTSIAPQTSAVRLQNATHAAESGVSPLIDRPASPADMIAAVAESAPTTSSLEAPSSANRTVGKMIVYRPVTIGVCAIDV